MTLCDAGPLIALIDRDDPHHQQCVAALANLPPTALVTACRVSRRQCICSIVPAGWRRKKELWGFIADGLVRLHLSGADEWRRMHALMNQYADMPLDMADASLVSAAESLQHFALLSLDARLRAVKSANHRSFDVLH